MLKRTIVYLSFMIAVGTLTNTSYAQGMSAGASQGRGQSFGMQQQQRAAEGLARRDQNRMRSQRDQRGANPAERGSETAIEMRERRDERREIMDDYRETRVPGQEGRPNPEDREEEPAKKRWWRFWDRDDSSG